MFTRKTNIIPQLLQNLKWWSSTGDTKTGLSTIIQPIMDIQKNGELTGIYRSTNVTSSGVKDLVQIPDREFWTILDAYAYVSSGTQTLAGISYVLPADQSLTAGWLTDPDSWAPGATMLNYPVKDSAAAFLTWGQASGIKKDLRLPPKTKIGLWVDSWSVAGYIVLYLYISRERYN